MRITTNQDPLSPIWTESSTTHQPPPHRGRSPSPKKTPLSSSSAGGATINLINADAVQSNTFHAHHHLPSPTDSIPSDPILYLPPLLSPLPVSVGTSSTGPLADFETRLPNIDPGSLALHQALHFFRPRNEGYASTPYHEAFNWDELCLPRDITREWYGVVFRSRRHLDSSSLSLYKADREAHEEAVKNGGLVMYWYGVPDSTGMNLATCIWQSRRHAVKAIMGPKHLVAMKQAKDAYEVYELERWVLSKEKGRTGLHLRRWEGGDVGW